MIRRPPRSTLDRSSAASDVYKRQTLSSKTKSCAPTFKFEIFIIILQNHAKNEAKYITEPLYNQTIQKVKDWDFGYKYDNLSEYQNNLLLSKVHLTS